MNSLCAVYWSILTLFKDKTFFSFSERSEVFIFFLLRGSLNECHFSVLILFFKAFLCDTFPPISVFNLSRTLFSVPIDFSSYYWLISVMQYSGLECYMKEFAFSCGNSAMELSSIFFCFMSCNTSLTDSLCEWILGNLIR